MTDKDKLQAIKDEIEFLKKEVLEGTFGAASLCLDRLTCFIDSLTEEPASEDLIAFKASAKWQKQQIQNQK